VTRRVGVDAHVLDGKFQGSRSFVENVLRAIGRQDARNTYVIYSFDPDRTRALFAFPSFEHRRIALHAAIPRLLVFWPWAARRDRLDVLLTQYIAPPFGAARQFVLIHDILFESFPRMFPPILRWRLRLLCRLSAWRAHTIFTVSRYSAGEIARRYRIPEQRIRITPDAADPPGAQDPDATKAVRALQPFLLCVGRLEPRKNIALALSASAAARARGVRLVVVGREDFASAQLAQMLAAAPNVVHLRDVPAPLLAALYAHALALIFPSLGEGFGMPVLEALAHGTPVLASDRTGIPEAGGALARYFDPGATDAETTLAGLIAQVGSGEFRPDPAALAAHLQDFTWTKSAAEIIAAVDALPP
jgi:glycosyltransferase involved in cell wall biosynthesis